MPKPALYSVRKARGDDFEHVYPLLQTFPNPALSKANWKKVFANPWRAPEDFCGYLLIRDGAIAGYLGLLFSRRLFDGRTAKFCNLTSWVVREDCRGHSLKLLLEALKLTDHTFTNFTASPVVATVMRRFGFTEFAVHQRVLLPVPRFGRTEPGIGCEFDLETVRSRLTGESAKILDDHRGLDLQHMLLRSPRGDCYVVLKRATRRKLPFARVHFLSHPDVFHDCLRSLIVTICRRLRVVGVMVDERYLDGRAVRASVAYPHQRRAYVKSPVPLDVNRIDTLYSEVVLLHD